MLVDAFFQALHSLRCVQSVGGLSTGFRADLRGKGDVIFGGT